MNVTREVVTDLLPVYFSGEASGDTKVLVEDYFRSDPDFERVARSAATPLSVLQAAAPVAREVEKEKHDLECVRGALQRRKWWFGMALFLTLAPLSFVFTNGHISWLMVRDAPWDAGFYWSLAALNWFLYFARLRRQTTLLVAVIFFTLLAFYFTLHLAFINALARKDSLGEAAIIWIGAGLCWFGYFRRHRR
ncbi:MAG TPA: hypothetical protein VGU63_03290 [Candidatus Acidoferrales bacterium]|nr:hypothetical protein [Candidatus Acidoferrales bacterium]